MVWALDLVTSKEKRTKWGKEHGFTRRLNELTMERGLIGRTWDVMHFAPPLIVTRDEVDRIVAIADESLTIAEREFADELTD